MTQPSTPQPEPTPYGGPPYAAPPYAAPPGGYYPPPYQPPLAPNGAPLADFGPRPLAYLIDAAIVVAAVVPLLLLAFVGLFSLLDVSGGDPPPALVLLLFLAYLAVFFGVYYVYLVEMMFRSGQTVGKRVMNLRIVPVDPDATLTRGMAVRRYLVQVVGGFLGSCVFFSYLDGLWQLWDRPYRQCLHDKFATTVVVRTQP